MDPAMRRRAIGTQLAGRAPRNAGRGTGGRARSGNDFGGGHTVGEGRSGGDGTRPPAEGGWTLPPDC